MIDRLNGPLARNFRNSQEDDGGDPLSGDTQTTVPDYIFEGYSIEFLEKVALLPLTPGAAVKTIISKAG